MQSQWKNSLMENGAGCTFGEAPVASHDAAMRCSASVVWFRWFVAHPKVEWGSIFQAWPACSFAINIPYKTLHVVHVFPKKNKSWCWSTTFPSSRIGSFTMCYSSRWASIFCLTIFQSVQVRMWRFRFVTLAAAHPDPPVQQHLAAFRSWTLLVFSWADGRASSSHQTGHDRTQSPADIPFHIHKFFI